MSAARRRSHLSDTQRIRALASPARLEIIEVLQVGGPATVAEIARRLARRPDSLYHHLRRLEAAGIVVECGRRTEGGRAARVLRVVPGTVAVGLGPKASPALRQAVAGIAASILRMGEREVSKVAMSPQVRTSGKHRNLHAARQKLWLTPGELEELNAEIDELRARYAGLKRREGARLFALTTVLVPAEGTGRSVSSPSRRGSSARRRRSSK
jgi:DNA-binding transcriptional ArsR family regulator